MKYKISIYCIIAIAIFTIFSCQLDMNNLAEDEIPELKDLSIIDIDSPNLIRDIGVIRYIDLEGGFYGIYGKTGNYDPVNLPEVFRQDGLRVEFTAELLYDMASIHMWGKLIKIISMKTLNSEKQLVMDTGIIQHINIQGRPWLIRATTGTYQALNLPREFMVDNLKVNFVGLIRKDIIIIPALWPILQIIEIERAKPGPIIVNLGERFKLPVTQSALVPKNQILLTFKSVLSDSRCPNGVTCIWAGEATVLVNVKIGSIDYGDFKMSTMQIPSTINVGRYYVQFLGLYPYPTYNKPIDPNSYVGYFLIDSALEITEPLN